MPTLKDIYSLYAESVLRRKTVYSEIFQRVETGNGAPKELVIRAGSHEFALPVSAARNARSLVWMKSTALTQRFFEFRIIAEVVSPALSKRHRYERAELAMLYKDHPACPPGTATAYLFGSIGAVLLSEGFGFSQSQPFRRKLLAPTKPSHQITTREPC